MPTSSPLWALPPDAAQPILQEIANHLQARDAARPQPSAVVGAVQSGESKGYTVQNGVAVITISGTITRKPIFSNWTGLPITQGQDTIEAALDRALTDSSVRSILLDINSPGGTVPGTKELADRIAAAASIKPMAAYANGLMASAAFWLGAATGRVMAPVTATVGSIGVIWVHADWSKLNEKYGIAYSYITGGKWKAAGNPDNPLTPEERDYFQRQVSQIHEIFKADVVSGLGIKAPAEKWAEGQTLLAEDAKSVGLVTHIVRDLTSAITALSQEATMDYKTFAAQHPELLASIENNAKAAATQEAEAKAKTTTEEARASVLALVKTVAGEEMHAHISRLVQANVTPAMMEAFAPLLAQPAQAPTGQAASEEDKLKAAILQGLHAASPAPVAGPGGVAAQQKSSIVARAEARAEQAKK